MKSIKTYLLSLFLLVFFSVPTFSQSGLVKDKGRQEQIFSKADSVLAESYLSERDYNELNGISSSNQECCDEIYLGNEIYSDEPKQNNKKRNYFWDSAAAELVVEVVVNSVFLIATFWH
jgi:hypothetical protein